MERRHLWRDRPSLIVQQRIEEANASRLYLLQEIGPTAFIVGHDRVSGQQSEDTASQRAKKYRVLIGIQQKCSCNDSSEICVHVLFIMLKVLRVPKDNPLVWQRSLLDHEVGKILQGYFRRDTTPKKKYQPRAKKKIGFAAVEQRKIGEDDSCPICQEQLDQTSRLVFCSRSCGNSVHEECMLVWAAHRRSVKEEVTCPLCREIWDPIGLTKKKIPGSKTALHRGFKCSACASKSLSGVLFACCVCSDFCLCFTCERTQLRAHQSLHRAPTMVVRTSPGAPWKPAIDVSTRFSLRNEGVRLRQVQTAALVNDLQSRDITPEDYELLQSLDVMGSTRSSTVSNMPSFTDEELASDVSLAEFLVAARPKLPRSNSSRCVDCIGTRGTQVDEPPSQLRSLPCGHAMHSQCLHKLVQQCAECCCPLDGHAIFPPMQKRRQRVRAADPQEGRTAISLSAGLEHMIQGTSLKFSSPVSFTSQSQTQRPLREVRYGRRTGSRTIQSAPTTPAEPLLSSTRSQPLSCLTEGLSLSGETVSRCPPKNNSATSCNPVTRRKTTQKLPRYGRRALDETPLRFKPARHAIVATKPQPPSTSTGRLAKGFAYKKLPVREFYTERSPELQPWPSPKLEDIDATLDTLLCNRAQNQHIKKV